MARAASATVLALETYYQHTQNNTKMPSKLALALALSPVQMLRPTKNRASAKRCKQKAPARP